MLDINQVYLGDCLEVMKEIDDKSIDMILCDLPYGTTACKWDVVIPYEHLWEQYKRIIKGKRAIVLTATQPFTSLLVCSNLNWFRHDWVWKKNRATNHLNAKLRPLTNKEDIVVFSGNSVFYKPELTDTHRMILNSRSDSLRGKGNETSTVSGGIKYEYYLQTNTNYPRQILEFSIDEPRLHSTQKPVALFEYLIKTYSSERDLILDNCAGSGTTGIAAKNTNRNFILIEKEKEYVDIIQKRLAGWTPKQIKTKQKTVVKSLSLL